MIHGFFPHIHRLHPACHSSCDHGRSQFIGNTVASLLLFCYSEAAYWIVWVNFVEYGWLILPQKPSYTTRAFLHSRHFTNNWLRNVTTAYASCWQQKKSSRVSLWSAANHMWLAQFVCAPQFFKTPKGLCGHTVWYTLQTMDNKCTLSVKHCTNLHKITIYSVTHPPQWWQICMK
jgi:hypothetical protein